jgi:LmbE family N-acetylglucosaminyl deacetylase
VGRDEAYSQCNSEGVEITKVLIITAHPDDAELGCGGTMARLIREGHQVGVHVFSMSDSIEGNDGISEEVESSLHGVYNVDFAVHDYRTMYFTEQYQAIRNDIHSIKEFVKPDVVYCKSPHALHPDHRVIGEACESIFLETTVYGIEGIRDSQNQKINKWVELGVSDLDIKLQVLKKYKSQKDKHYFNPEAITAWARFRGTQIGKPFAEGFEVIREVS